MCRHTIAEKNWRVALERGDAPEFHANLAYKQAASPIIPKADAFVKLMLDCDGDMAKVAKALGANSNVLLWSADFRDILEMFHRDAHYLGFGTRQVPTLTEGRVWEVLHQPGSNGFSELDYMEQFLGDLLNRDSRYFDPETGWDDNEILRRMRMYQGKMRGTAGWGFVDRQPPGGEINWVLGGVEEHCEDCPAFANLSPWYRDTLIATPGSGETPCLFNCKCHLEGDSGEESPYPVEREPVESTQ
jgi:hypothetical protein